MDTEKSATALPSIRTFAKDQARSQNGDSTVPSVSKTTSPAAAVPKANIVGAGESRLYQAPTAKEIPLQPKDEPAPKPPTPQKSIPKPPAAPKDTLRPLTRPKLNQDTAIVVDNEDAGSATIIRDTKHDRFRLFPAIGTSLKKWFEGIKDRYFTKKAPKYTVPETTRRKGVIQKATSKTGKLATFDNTSLQARIKERESRAVPKSPTTTWTANTEPGFALLEAPEGEERVTNVQVVPRKSHLAPTRSASQPVEETKQPVAATPNTRPLVPKKPTIIVASETEPIINTPEPDPEPEPEPEPVKVLPAAEPRREVVRPPQPATPPVTKLKPTSLREWLFTLNTNLIALGIAGLFLAVGIVVLTGYAIYQKNVSTITVTALPNHPTLIEAPLQIVYADGLSRERLIEQVRNNLTATGRPDTLQLAFATKGTGGLLPAHAVMTSLSFHTNAPFARSLNAIYFGAASDGTPFILLKTTDDTTALGGMLSWEASLYEDLSPVFTMTNNTQLSDTPTFKDRVLGSVDIRTQITSAGEVILAYNKPVSNVIIITTSVATLEALLPLIK